MIRSISIIFFIIFLGYYIKAQTKYPQEDFISPLDIPIKLSGTFGELRSNHFHSGIDIKTGEIEGLNIYAIADGYVSRIKVQAGGYGKAIYVTHPNGYVSVYGHLSKYNEKIDEYVTRQQYYRKSYELNIFPKSDELAVTQGEIIAYSGNTGRSGGPHLHFEIRDGATEKPINPLLFNYKVADNIPPRINVIKVYNIDSEGQIESQLSSKVFYCQKKGQNYHLSISDTIAANGNLYFGINTYDPFNGGMNKNGVYSIKLYINESLHYSHDVETFGFDETRYINSFIDYEEYISNSRRIQKSYVQPNNKLSIYLTNKGILKVEKGDKFNIRYEVSDIAGNTSTVIFWVKGTEKRVIRKKNQLSDENIFYYTQSNSFQTDSFKIEIPGNSLYDTLHFKYSSSPSMKKTFSAIHHIHNKNVPLHTRCPISIKSNSLEESLYSKALIAKIKDNNEFSSVGGEWSNGLIRTNIREFGSYCIVVDTIKPEIKPVNIKKNKSLLAQNTIKVKISDKLSGINSYSAYLNDVWILMEYDVKNDLLIYYFDKHLKEGVNKFKLVVSDNKDNTSEYETTLNY